MATATANSSLSSLNEDQKLKNLENIEVKLTVQAGSANITVKDLINLNVGSVVELNTQAGEHLAARANGTLILRGEIVTIGETLGYRITDIIGKDERAVDQS